MGSAPDGWAAVQALLSGGGGAALLCLLVNRVTSEMVCRLSPLATAELIDEERAYAARIDRHRDDADAVGDAGRSAVVAVADAGASGGASTNAASAWQRAGAGEAAGGGDDDNDSGSGGDRGGGGGGEDVASASVVGGASFLAKIAGSLAPLLALTWLGERPLVVTGGDLADGVAMADAGSTAAIASDAAWVATAWRLAVGVPTVLVSVQLVAWLVGWRPVRR